MLRQFTDRNATRRKARDLYGAIVTQARRVEFFRDMGVADTPEGRFEVLAAHLLLVLERLKANGAASADLQRELIEAFVADLDDNMREMGVGDMGVGRRVKAAAAAFYERAGVYAGPLARGDTERLAAALTDRLGQAGAAVDATAFADYMIGAAKALSGRPLGAGCDVFTGVGSPK